MADKTVFDPMKPSTTGWYPPAPRIVTDEERAAQTHDATSTMHEGVAHFPPAPRVEGDAAGGEDENSQADEASGEPPLPGDRR